MVDKSFINYNNMLYCWVLIGRANPPDLLKVQLGDETDAKMLLGTYCCTDIPGEFVWQPGVLTQVSGLSMNASHT